jgi:hypothetical protein
LLLLQLNTVVNAVDQYTEDISYTDRIKSAFWGFILGWILLAFSLIFLWVIEGQAVEYDWILHRCRKATRIVPDADVTSVDPANDEQSVFVKGKTHISSDAAVAYDPATGFLYSGSSRLPVRLKRTAEMYQWLEHKHKDKDTTSYTYTMEWAEQDSTGSFHYPEGHHNPPRSPAVYSNTTDALSVVCLLLTQY